MTDAEMPRFKRHEDHDPDVTDNATPALQSISPLHTIPGFADLSRRKFYPKGSLLFVEGFPACGVHVLRAGYAKLSITSEEGKTFILRIARPGDLLGLHATLAGNGYEATVEALAPCQVDFISRENLLVLWGRRNPNDLRLVLAVGQDFTEFIEHARVLLLTKSVVQRVARLLIRLADEFGESTRAGIRFDTLLTHDDIAQMVGSSRETVTRSLSLLKRKRIIFAVNGDFVIRDRAALIAFAKSFGTRSETLGRRPYEID